jgi:cell division protein FtsB
MGFATSQGIWVTIGLAALGIACEIILRAQGWSAVKRVHRLLVSAIAPIVFLLGVTFLCYLVATPASMWAKDQQTISALRSDVDKQQKEVASLKEEVAIAKRRIQELASRLPPPGLSQEQKSRLKSALEKIDRRTVHIKYIDQEIGHAGAIAGELASVFRSALWHVEMHGSGSMEKLSVMRGLYMKVEDMTSMTEAQKAVLAALRESNISCTLLGGQDVADRIELEVRDI